MRVLVATASKHGSTHEVGAFVADELRLAGHEVRTADAAVLLELADVVDELTDVDAAVVGSPVYGARVLAQGKAVAERLTRTLAGPVWVFAVGIKSPTADPLRPAVTAPASDGYRGARYPVFGGVVDTRRLSAAERALIGAVGAADRDRRDPEMVRAWAQAVACRLAVQAQGSSSTLPVV